MIVEYTEKEFKNAKSTDVLPLKCERCGKIFYAEKRQIGFELKHNRGSLKYCSTKCANLARTKKHKTYCEECGKEIEIVYCRYNKSKTKHFFCSKSCAVKYNNRFRKRNEETKQKISESLKKWHSLNKKLENKPKPKKQSICKERICVVCGKHYYYERGLNTGKACSKECSEYRIKHHKEFLSTASIESMSKSGRKSVIIQGDSRRSKNEKYFCELCEKHFKNVKHNEPMFNGWDADVIIEDIKLAVLWNGKWHYEKITNNHSVEQV